MVIITSYPYWNAESSWNTRPVLGHECRSALDYHSKFLVSNCDRFMAHFSGSKSNDPPRKTHFTGMELGCYLTCRAHVGDTD